MDQQGYISETLLSKKKLQLYVKPTGDVSAVSHVCLVPQHTADLHCPLPPRQEGPWAALAPGLEQKLREGSLRSQHTSRHPPLPLSGTPLPPHCLDHSVIPRSRTPCTPLSNVLECNAMLAVLKNKKKRKKEKRNK